MIHRAARAPLFAAAFAAFPLIWAACTEPPPARPPETPVLVAPPTLAPEPTESAPSIAAQQDGASSTRATGPAEPASSELESLIAAIPRFKPGTDLPRPACQALAEKGAAARYAAHQMARACSVTSDCQQVNDNFCGRPAFCGGAFAAKTAAPAYSAAWSRIEAIVCPAWSAGGCEMKYAEPAASCVQPGLMCKDGKCGGYK